MTSFLVKKESEKPMEKEEVLAMSRKEKNDEGLVAAENQGRKVGFLAFCALFIVIIFFNLFTGQINYAPMTLFWGFIAAEAYPKYAFTKKSGYLITVILGALASICCLTAHIVSVLL